MVDIRVGAVHPPPQAQATPREKSAKGVFGTVVATRPGRRRQSDGEAPGQRRRRGAKRDPVGSRVLTILVADGTLLPPDGELESKRVLIQIVD